MILQQASKHSSDISLNVGGDQILSLLCIKCFTVYTLWGYVNIVAVEYWPQGLSYFFQSLVRLASLCINAYISSSLLCTIKL